MNMKKITIFTDGGARGNPGPAGAGAAIFDESGETLKEASRFLGERTNNWAEYEAVILGLETLKKMYSASKLKEITIDMRLDSELVTRQLNREYQIKKETLFPQFIKVHNFMVKDFPNITFTHVRRENNKVADRLANEAMDKGRSPVSF